MQSKPKAASMQYSPYDDLGLRVLVLDGGHVSASRVRNGRLEHFLARQQFQLIRKNWWIALWMKDPWNYLPSKCLYDRNYNGISKLAVSLSV
jgi:hypothetical protein